jgi:hypothetical protein
MKQGRVQGGAAHAWRAVIAKLAEWCPSANPAAGSAVIVAPSGEALPAPMPRGTHAAAPCRRHSNVAPLGSSMYTRHARKAGRAAVGTRRTAVRRGDGEVGDMMVFRGVWMALRPWCTLLPLGMICLGYSRSACWDARYRPLQG